MEKKHRIYLKDFTKKTAFCLECGIIEIIFRHKLWRCINGYKETHRKTNLKIRTRFLLNSNKPKNCQICGTLGKICYDHDHVTNQFRGWLCNNCNVALGLVKDNPIILRALADYLDKKTPIS